MIEELVTDDDGNLVHRITTGDETIVTQDDLDADVQRANDDILRAQNSINVLQAGLEDLQTLAATATSIQSQASVLKPIPSPPVMSPPVIIDPVQKIT